MAICSRQTASETADTALKRHVAYQTLRNDLGMRVGEVI